MSLRPLLLAALLLLSSLTIAPVSAQESPLPGIEITCANEENTLFLEPNSNGAQATATCTIENPSSFNEDIEIDYDGDGLTMVGPESMSLDAGAKETIQIIVSSNSLASTVYNMTVSVQVTSVQGQDWLQFLEMFLPSDETNIVAQVAEFVDLSSNLQPNSLMLSSELMQPMSTTLMVTNNGNVDDDLTIVIQDSALLDQKNIGWNLTNSGQGSTIDSNGGSATYTLRLTPNPAMADESFAVVIRIQSSVDNSQSIDITLTVNTTAPEETLLDLTSMNIPTWAYIAAGTLAVLILFATVLSLSKRSKRSSRIQNEDDDDDEEDFDFDDLDYSIDDTADSDDELDDFDLDDFEL